MSEPGLVRADSANGRKQNNLESPKNNTNNQVNRPIAIWLVKIII